MNLKRTPKPVNSRATPSAPPIASQPVDPQTAPFPVVGIGASAGGLEAFTQLLSHLPIDTGMAFVLVQHLDPNQKSLLTEILAKTTAIPVDEIQEGMAVEPNHVYVIPPNQTLAIAQGVLRLTPRAKARKVSLSIDGFFYSLAADRAAKAIGVVLSGGDMDGTKGLEAIKEAGGITFAQSEDSAQFPSMPQAAIATGQVDFILSPSEIAEKLASLSRHPYVSSRVPTIPAVESPASKDALTTIFSLLRTATKLDFTQYKHTTLNRRIARRMALHQIEELADYVRYLQENPVEVQALYQEILITVTHFFRDAEAFDALKQQVFPALLRNRTADLPLRIWVAGCSTGEEAYSIAICLLEYLDPQPRKPPIQIFATDVSEQAIEKARLGVYSQNQVLDVSPERLQRFFTPSDGSYQINKSVRELCIFARQNLISDPPFSRLDLISCRNVFIYFGAALQKKVLSMFHYGLTPTGFLFLGSSETVGELPDLFTAIAQKSKIYGKQSASTQLNLDLIGGDAPSESFNPQPLLGDLSDEGSRPELDLYGTADQIVLQQYAPVGVVIDGQLEILQFRGQTGAYLEPAPGRASLNLLNMAKEGLQLELRTAIHQAKQEGKAVRKVGIPLQEGDRSLGSDRPVRQRQVCIDVIPLKLTAQSNETFFLVLFEDLPQRPSLVEATEMTRRPPSRRKQPTTAELEIQQLQQELGNTRAYLQSIIQEQQSTNQDLRAANEEILSSNEELQSTNEELQTAKEEIQATNEELSTINEELYRRNAETLEISNDLQNFLDSVNIAILMLACDLRIRRFTTAAARLFNLIPTDIGRPVGNINHNLHISDLEQQILAVIASLNVHSQEIQDQSGRWYDLRIRPYRTLDNRIDGAVVMLIDIDTLKHGSDQLLEARDYAEAIVETVRESLVVLDAQLRVKTANQAFYQTFQVSVDETEHCLIFELGNGQWNIPALRSLLEDLLPHNTQIGNFRVEHEFEQVGHKILLLNARQIKPNPGDPLILLAIEDISDRQ
jgi:two-component system CheB/CheR fusion protein